MLNWRFSEHYRRRSRPYDRLNGVVFRNLTYGEAVCIPLENPMALDRSDVEKIAHLARLGLNDADIPRTTEALNIILGLIDQMQAVDTTGIEPLAHPLEASQRLREDVVSETNHRDAYQAIAPAVEDGLYLVPKVLD